MRKQDLAPTDPYYAAWHEYSRIWRRSIFLTLALFVVGGGLASVLVEALLPRGPDWLPLVAVAPWVIAAIAVSQPPMRWHCPRCGQRFLSGKTGYNGLARACLHCGLPKWAPSGTV